MHVRCYKIEFAERASEITVSGSDALANFMSTVEVNSTGLSPWISPITNSTSEVPEYVDVEVDLPED